MGNITAEEIRRIIREELPKIIQEDREIRFELWNLLSSDFASKKQTEDRFEKILEEIKEQKNEIKQIQHQIIQINLRLEKHEQRFEELLKEIRNQTTKLKEKLS